MATSRNPWDVESMAGPAPHCTAGRWPERPVGRFASSIRTESSKHCAVAILGMPDDTGVRLNGGRPGAAQGPTAFRAALARYGVAEPAGFEWPLVYDAGDVTPAPGGDEAALQETHRRVTEAVHAIGKAGLFPVGIGGGHDLTFPFLRARTQEFPRFTVLSIDAHLDVRETAGSGMVFRRLIKDCGVERVSVFGLNPLVNSREHLQWFEKHGGKVLTKRAEAMDDAFNHPMVGAVTVDLDAIDASQAPGVSAPNPCGLSIADVAAVVHSGATSPAVVAMDFMELCPPHDEGGRTARLAAHLFLVMLRGLAIRWNRA